MVSYGIRNMVAGVRMLLGTTRSAMVFLDQAGWICSLSKKKVAEAKSYTRHFYIPPFWRVRGDLQIKIVGRNSLAIPSKDEVVIVHGFMDFSHEMVFPAFPDDDGSDHHGMDIQSPSLRAPRCN